MASQATYPLEIALSLARTGAELVAQRYRRQNPGASEDEVASIVQQWWRDRPGAPNGDAVGRVRPVPEHLR